MTVGSTAEARTVRRWSVLAISLTGQFLLLLDVSVVNVAVPTIRSGLGASPTAIGLIVAGYQLAYAAVLLGAGRLGDVIGRRRLFLGGMAGFSAASLLAALAPTTELLVIARLVQGLAGGVMLPQVLATVDATFPDRGRGTAFGLLGATIGIATAVGPLFSGLLLALDPLAGWRWAFAVNVPVGLLALAAGARLLPEGRAVRGQAVDVIGTVLLVAAIAGLVLPFVLATGRPPVPADGLALLVGLLPVAALVAHLRRRTRTAHDPVLPPALFGRSTFVAGSAATFVLMMGIPAFFFVSTLLLQDGLGLSALDTGLIQFVFALTTAAGSVLGGRLVGRIGPAVLVLGCAVLVLAMAGLAAAVLVLGPALNPWTIFVPLLAVAGTGFGLFVAPAPSLALAGVSEDRGSAAGALSTAQNVGSAVGVAVAGWIYFAMTDPSDPASSVSAFLRFLGYELAIFSAALLITLKIRRVMS